MDIKINIIHSDCFEALENIKDNSVKMIYLDPPYGIKKDSWDHFESQEAYYDFIFEIFRESERVLMESGSLYISHSVHDVICDFVMWFRKNSRLKKKNLITWSKMDENDKRLNGMILKRLNAGQSRKYYRGLTEYILLYAFQDSTGLDVVRKNVDNFPELRKYFYDMLEYIGKTRNQINDQLGHRKAEHCFYVSRKTIIDEIDGKADHYFRYGSSQWALPTKKTYQELIDTYKIDEWKGFRDYEGLVRDYEELVRDYETKRYTFNTIKKEYDGTIRSAQQNNCVQIYKPVNTMKSGHATPKPVEMIENFILHSTNEGDLVLDPFGGSGTTALACIRTNRNCIIVEREKEYIDLIEKNIEIEKKLKKLGKIGERVHVKTRKLRQLQLFK